LRFIAFDQGVVTTRSVRTNEQTNERTNERGGGTARIQLCLRRHCRQTLPVHRYGILLQMLHVAWSMWLSVGVYVCVMHTG